MKRHATAVLTAAVVGGATLSAPAGAQEIGLRPVPSAVVVGPAVEREVLTDGGEKLVSVVVKLQADSVAAYRGDLPGLPPTSPAVTGRPVAEADPDVRAYRSHLAQERAAFTDELRRTVPGARVVRAYDYVLGGVNVLVPRSGLDLLTDVTGVRAVYPDQLLQLQTDSTPAFIGATQAWDHLGGESVAGEGVVVGVIDTGIWPEHPSLADPDPRGKPYPAPPVRPGSRGFVGEHDACNFGDTAYNGDDAPFTCNSKLIGAYDFTQTYAAFVGLSPTEFASARDSNGHGTHTATTAAGSSGVAASLLGVPRGTVSGIAPRAHVVAYKSCGELGCFTSDSAAAVQQAVLDGVDVLNFSVSGGAQPYADAVSLAFLDAYEAGVLATPSAGNSGPGADTVAHREPWTLTVGATTSNRRFVSTVSLLSADGATLTLQGASVTEGIGSPTPVAHPPAGQELCNEPFPPGTFDGEVVVCQRGVTARVVKGLNVRAGGAAGMLLINPSPQGVATDNHHLPAVHLEDVEGRALLSFLETRSGVTVTFTAGDATAGQGDVVAPFSSRGGPGQLLGISKPDVAAPGVQVLAGNTPLPESGSGGAPGQLFQAIQGTSMSAPHAAGAAALVVDAHPDWTAGQVRSALMTTAGAAGVTKQDAVTPADAFDVGTGRIRPAAAVRAAAVFDETAENYVTLAGNLWDANHPSLYLPVLDGVVTVRRTLTDTTGSDGVWTPSVSAPADLRITLPRTLEVPAGGNLTFPVSVDASTVPEGEVRHATVVFRKTNQPEQGQELRFPVTVVRRATAVTVDHTCTPLMVPAGTATSCQVTVRNGTTGPAEVAVTADVPAGLVLDRESVVGGTADPSGRLVRSTGTLAGERLPSPDLAYGAGPPFGYVPLSDFSGSLDVGAGDETIANVDVPSFRLGGRQYTTLGVVSNGYLVLGGGTAGDVQYINTDLPDAAPPNGVLAPFWTDLDADAAGRVLVNVLTDGDDTWVVVEWEAVANYADAELNTFQVWLGLDDDANPGEDVTFTYGPSLSDGDGGFLTVGVEDSAGSAGGRLYFDGEGTPPAPGSGVDVVAAPGEPGETRSLTWRATGRKAGPWTSTTTVTSDAFAGSAVRRVTGVVVR